MIKKTINTLPQDHEILSLTGHFTFPQLLLHQAERLGAEKIAVREKAYGIWRPYIWKEYLEYVKFVCLGLLSLGFKRGENLGFIIDNRPEWLFTSMGAQAAGGVIFNLFTSSLATELVHDLNRLEASFVFVEKRRDVEKLLAHRDSLTNLKRVIFIDPTNMMMYKDDPWLLSYSQLMELGKNFDKENPELFSDALWNGKSDDTAMLLMTSGTLGIPKPAMITHGNLMETARKWLENIRLSSSDNWVSLSPCAGIIEQTWCLGIALACGMTINFPETSESAMNDMREIGPTVIVNYPSFWESIMSLIKGSLDDSGPFQKWLYNHSFGIGKSIYDLESKGSSVPFNKRCLQKLYRAIITNPLMDRVGLLNVCHAYSGGYPISPEVIKFFRFNGLDLKQCYGLAETGGMFQFQTDDDYSTDTVGKPKSGTQLTISEDNEILVSGKFNFSAYYDDPETSSKTLKNGILFTGDAGYFDDNGRLAIIGRKEDILKNEKGLLFSREHIEIRIKESLYIREAVIWGKGKPYLIAFVGIDKENILRWAARQNISFHGYDEVIQHPEIEKLIKNEIYDLNLKLPEQMRIRKVIPIHKPLNMDGEFTKTGTARRKFLFEQSREILEAVYNDKESAMLRSRLRDSHDEIRIINTAIRIISVP
jgi:long-chain acyl-CoA synthetase